MNEVPLGVLSGILFCLILLSAFFSSSETGMLSINKYRLKHLVKTKNRSAIKVNSLLERPDRLIGVILIGNNFVNILASAIATIIAVRLWGDAGVAIATAALTMVVLIFAEVTPKTLAAIHPEKIAFPASWILAILLKVLYPLVWLVNGLSNGLLRLIGVHASQNNHDKLDSEELRTVVNEASGLIPAAHQDMLLSILDLEKVSVEDIMIPRNEVIGIDIEDSIEEIIEQICQSRHTRMPVYNGEINKVIGILHARHAAVFLRDPTPSKAALLKATVEPYFIPESTSLNTVLLNFQKDHQQMGIVVDEYGDVQGIAALEDVLEEIVGEFTPPTLDEEEIQTLEDGSFRIEGSTHIREINKTLDWHLPTDGPKTLNGLIIETLEFIPEHPISLWVGHYMIEIQEIEDKVVKYAKLRLKH